MKTGFHAQVKQTDVAEGDIDALSNRIAHIRTWTFISHRQEWLKDAAHWQGETKAIEDKLSDALHERLTKRFVDRRTSVLMKRLRENTMLEAEIAPSGAVTVEGHHVGELSGFQFKPDSAANGPDAKAATAAALKALASEIEARSTRLGAAPNSDIVLQSDGTIRWVGAPVARVIVGEETLKPKILLLADEQLTGPARDKVAARLERWLTHHIETHLKPLLELLDSEGVEGMARGVAYRIAENLGTVDRREIANDVRSLDQDQRAVLRRKGVRFGAYHIFVPLLLKPAPAGLVAFLWGLKFDKLDAPGREEIITALAAGRTSMPIDSAFEETLYRLAGFRVLGKKAVRVDILERLADLIRPASGWRFRPQVPSKRPEGAWDGAGFMITTAMLSILGATHEDMADILRGLGYRGESMLESDVNAKLEQWDLANLTPDKEDNSEGEIESAKPSKPDDKSEKSIDIEKTEVLKQDQKTNEDSEEPKRIEIWRQNREGRHANHGAKGGKKFGRDKPQSARGQHSVTKKYSGKPGSRNKPADKPIDPDSPFAALLALKGELKGKK